MPCQQQQNLTNCNCTYQGCPRHGICCDCLNYHRQRQELPACYFSKEMEKTYDRSIDNFIKNQP